MHDNAIDVRMMLINILERKLLLQIDGTLYCYFFDQWIDIDDLGGLVVNTVSTRFDGPGFDSRTK